MTDDALAETLQAHYGLAARRAAELAAGGDTCGSAVDACSPGRDDDEVFGAGSYAAAELADLPPRGGRGRASAAPTRSPWRHLEPGEDVLDLGSGGGIDVLLSGPPGRPRRTRLRRGHDRQRCSNWPAPTRPAPGSTNVEFLEGRIEAVPLPDGSVDVVVSNCVINLSADKAAVFAEALPAAPPSAAAWPSRTWWPTTFPIRRSGATDAAWAGVRRRRDHP